MANTGTNSNDNGKSRGDTETIRKRILFQTSAEYGQAQVILAVAYELLLHHPEYAVHIMSFAPLKDRVADLNKLVAAKIPGVANAAIFHPLPGLAALEALYRKDPHLGPHPPGIKGAIQTYTKTLPAAATSWDGPEYIEGYNACLEIITSVDPHTIVSDPIFAHGLDACLTLKREIVILSPNTFKEIVGKEQSAFSQLFRYPTPGAGYPVPLPLSLIPANLYLFFRLFCALVNIRFFNKGVKELLAYRRSQGLKNILRFTKFTPQQLYILPTLPEIDFKYKLFPNVTACGPILISVAPVYETDPKLDEWLRQGPTVLINLGSHIRADDSMVREMAGALKILLDQRADVKVLWKLKTRGGLGAAARDSKSESSKSFTDDLKNSSGFLDAISTEIAEGRVRIEEWLKVDPQAILDSGHVICAVHHGGANSYFEAINAGVPQVILPVWLDTYDFAHRVEYLGIGAYGSRKAAPRAEKIEFAEALMRVLGQTDESTRMQKRAVELARICRNAGGRVRACERLIEIIESSA